MKKLNQKGAIDMMFVVLLAVVLIVGGVVVWRVTGLDNETADSAVATTAGSESKNNGANKDNTTSDKLPIPDDWVEYENTETGVRFSHPSEWGTVVASDGSTGILNITFSDDEALEFGTPTISLLSSSYKTGGGGPSQQIIANGFSVKDGDVYSHSYVTGLDEADLQEPEKTKSSVLEIRTNSSNQEYAFAAEKRFNTPTYYAIFNLASDQYPGLQVSMKAGVEALGDSAAVFSVSEEDFMNFVNTILVK